MKKKLLSMLLCIALVLATAVPAFAAEPSTEPMPGIEDYSTSEQIQPRISAGVHAFGVSNNYYVNVNNAGHSGTACAQDPVILWTEVLGNDQQWKVESAYPGYYFRTKLNLALAMNINHVENKCTLLAPEGNKTNGKSDSIMDLKGSFIQLSEWPYQLTFSVLQPGYAGYWTASGTSFSDWVYPFA